MKKILLLFVCFPFALAFGQPVINLADITPQNNDTISMKGLASGPIYSISTGENMTWDFSGADTNANVYNVIFATSNQQGANYSVKSDAYKTEHYSYQADGVYLTRVIRPDMTQIYSDSKKILSFPLSSTSLNDSYSTSYTIGSNQHEHYGFYKSEYKGSGTLKTPAGTFTDVIMLNVHETATTSTNGAGGTPATRIEIHFYKAGYAYPLYIAKDGYPQASAWYQVVPVVDDEEEEEEDPEPGTNVGIESVKVSGIKLVPNPVSDIATIVGGVEGIKAVETIDLTGKVVNAIFDPTSKTINFSNLPDGAYFVRMISTNGVTVKKIIKK